MLALIAGQGALPAHLVAASETRPLIACLERFPPDTVTPDLTFRIEQLGSFLQTLKDKGVRDVCFAGSLERVPLDATEIDAATLPLVPRMMQALQSGDDAALRTVLTFFEEAGLTIRAAHEIAPDLLPEEGTLTDIAPDEVAQGDAARAKGILETMGSADIGQACVVHKGQALAIEALYGTAWMLESLKNRPDGIGGVLMKAPKPDQDLRIDLPAIGPQTIMQASAAGLSGIVLQQGGVMILERTKTIADANAARLFLWVQA
jgi:DUF1009 family protein